MGISYHGRPAVKCSTSCKVRDIKCFPVIADQDPVPLQLIHDNGKGRDLFADVPQQILGDEQRTGTDLCKPEKYDGPREEAEGLDVDEDQIAGMVEPGSEKT